MRAVTVGREIRRRWPAAIAATRRVLAEPGRYLILIDQGVLAVCRFAAIVIFARLLSTEEFGAIAVAISVAYLCVGFARATFALPFAAFCSDHNKMAEGAHQWLAFGLFLIAPAAALLTCAALLLQALDSPSWAKDAAAYSAMLSPMTLAYEISHRWLFQAEHYRAMLLQVLTWAVASVIGFLVFIALPLPWIATLSLCAGYLVATAVGLAGNLPQQPIEFRHIRAVWREMRQFTRWTIVEFLADSLQGYTMNIAVVLFAGPAGASIFTATRNAVAPIFTLVSALSAEMPRLARAYSSSGASGLTKALRGTQAFALIIGGPYLVLVAIFSEPILRLLYGTKYAGHSTELLLWALAALLLLLIRPLDMWLLASLDSRRLFMRKILGALATVSVAVPMLPLRGVEGALYAIVAGMAVNLLALATAVYGIRRRPMAAAQGMDGQMLETRPADAEGAASDVAPDAVSRGGLRANKSTRGRPAAVSSSHGRDRALPS
jgi:O-antigen/teichoic acid export membrane protein